MGRWKRIVSLLLMVCVAAGLFLSDGRKAEAMSAVRYAWRDEIGNIIVQTSDHRKTSSVHYKTVGFTITRCVLGTREPVEEQYITVRFNDALEDVGKEWTRSTYILSEAELLSRIAAASGEWLADIQSKKTCYLKFDAVMVCVDDSKTELTGKYSGAMKSEENQAYEIFSRAKYPGVWDKFTCEDLMYHTYDWCSPESIRTHFDIYLLYNGYEETRYYVLSYDLTYTDTMPVYETAGGSYVTDENGERIVVGEEDIECHVPVSFTVSRTADYYYAAALSLYELDEADVYNSVYPGDAIAYKNTKSASIKTILDGVPDAAETSAAPKPEEHIRFPEPYTKTIQHDCGTKAGCRSISTS